MRCTHPFREYNTEAIGAMNHQDAARAAPTWTCRIPWPVSRNRKHSRYQTSTSPGMEATAVTAVTSWQGATKEQSGVTPPPLTPPCPPLLAVADRLGVSLESGACTDHLQ